MNKSMYVLLAAAVISMSACKNETETAQTEAAEASAEAKGVLRQAGEVIEKTAEVCDNLDKIGNLVERGWTLASTVGPFLLSYFSKGG